MSAVYHGVLGFCSLASEVKAMDDVSDWWVDLLEALSETSKEPVLWLLASSKLLGYLLLT